MTDETKKLFNAPWKVDEKPSETFGEIFDVMDEDLYLHYARCYDEKTANRLAYLPELYDALLLCICSSCNVCIYTHCGSPVDCEQLLSQECTYEDSKICFEQKARELLKKVRDGE